jgi:hypothetical protein
MPVSLEVRVNVALEAVLVWLQQDDPLVPVPNAVWRKALLVPMVRIVIPVSGTSVLYHFHPRNPT